MLPAPYNVVLCSKYSTAHCLMNCSSAQQEFHCPLPLQRGSVPQEIPCPLPPTAW